MGSFRALISRLPFRGAPGKINRILGVEPPPELRAKLNMKEAETCELLKCSCGLVNAPYLWYVEPKEILLALQFQITHLDPCLFCVLGKKEQIHGFIGMHFDDGLCCGDERFERTLNQLWLQTTTKPHFHWKTRHSR